MDDAVTVWPDLPYASWRETAATLQLWTQIVGKVRLTLTPWLNHGWQVPLNVTAGGLGTSPIPVGNEILGLSGRPGFLELTGNREELTRIRW